MHYDQEFKDKIITEVEQTQSLSVVAKKHKIATSTIHGWIKKKDKPVKLKAEVKNIELKDENKKLKTKLADAELELMILKDLLKKTYQH